MRISDWSSDVGSSDLRALDLATSEWVLSIDADERVPAELAGAIRRELDQPRADGYRIGRLSNFCGRWIRHSGWWPDRVLRLFTREAGRFNDVAVHERVQCSGSVLVLDGHFLHYPYPDIETLIPKIHRYLSEVAIIILTNGHTVGLSGLVGQ